MMRMRARNERQPWLLVDSGSELVQAERLLSYGRYRSVNPPSGPEGAGLVFM